jgi:hypothetical protein
MIARTQRLWKNDKFLEAYILLEAYICKCYGGSLEAYILIPWKLIL